jgi:ADP-dependent NAD(P)H-hydrate dehydratase
VGGEGGKDARGCVLVIGGAPSMPGPVVLAATAALRAGAGRLQIATAAEVATAVGCAVPEALVHSLPASAKGALTSRGQQTLLAAIEGMNAIVLGPGLVGGPALPALGKALLRALGGEQVAVVDALALTRLGERAAGLHQLAGRLIVTPHAGEMAALLGREREEITADPMDAALTLARRWQVVVVMKGRETIITDGAAAWVNRAGNEGLGMSGSGDVLAGLIGGLAARGLSAMAAACWGVALHARAGDALARHGPLGYLARELAAEVPALMAKLSRA